MRVDTTEQIELQLQAHRPHSLSCTSAIQVQTLCDTERAKEDTLGQITSRHTVTYFIHLWQATVLENFEPKTFPMPIMAKRIQEGGLVKWQNCRRQSSSEQTVVGLNKIWNIYNTWNDNCFPLDSMDYTSPVWASLLTNRYKSTYHLLLERDKVNWGQLTEMTLVAGELLSTDFSVAWLQLQSSRSQLTGLKTLNVLMTLHVLWCRHSISFKTSRMEATVLEDSLKREKQRDSENHWCGWVFLVLILIDSRTMSTWWSYLRLHSTSSVTRREWPGENLPFCGQTNQSCVGSASTKRIHTCNTHFLLIGRESTV